MKTSFLFILLLSSIALAQTGKIEFEAIGKPSMVKIKGVSESLVADLSTKDRRVSGTITLKLQSLKTGIAMRDEHMHAKYLEVAKYPEARLTLSEAAANIFKGKLLLHGVEKDVTGNYSAEGTPLLVQADFEIKLSDFKIDIPVYLGIKVADIVKVHVTLNKVGLKKN